MIKRLSLKTLLIVLVLLAGVVALIKWKNPVKKESNFRTELVKIDTTAVTAIEIYLKDKPEQPVKIYRKEGVWYVQSDDQNSARANQGMVKGMLNQLTKLKPKRLAATSKDKWETYQVGEQATRVRVYEGDKTVLDLVLGKMAFQQQPQSIDTYVRLYDEEEVYVVPGFLEPTFNQQAENFRDKTIIKGNWEKWNRLTYSLPAMGSYTLEKTGEGWQVDGQPADKKKVESHLRSISNVMGIDMKKDFTPSRPADYKLVIESEMGKTITVEGFVTDSIQVYLHSSQNPDVYFDASKGNLKERLFKGRDNFILKEEETPAEDQNS